MKFPYTALIPANIAWFTSAQDWIAKTGVGPQTNPSTPTQMWRDNAFGWGSWWTTLGGDPSYKVLAPGLTPIDSPEFLATYTSLDVVKTYRELSFLFPAGVPYLIDMVVPRAQAQVFNFGGTSPARGYPVILGSDLMLLPPGADGVVMVQQYQEFAKENQPAFTDYNSMLATVDGIRKSGMSAKDQILAIRVAVKQGQAQIPAF